MNPYLNSRMKTIASPVTLSSRAPTRRSATTWGNSPAKNMARSSASTVIRSMPRRSVTTSNGTGRKGSPSQRAFFAPLILPRTTTLSTLPI